MKNISREASLALKGARKKRLMVTVIQPKLYPRTHATIKLVQLLGTDFTANLSLKVFWEHASLKVKLDRHITGNIIWQQWIFDNKFIKCFPQ